jgi:hypothetical protein
MYTCKLLHITRFKLVNLEKGKGNFSKGVLEKISDKYKICIEELFK